MVDLIRPIHLSHVQNLIREALKSASLERGPLADADAQVAAQKVVDWLEGCNWRFYTDYREPGHSNGSAPDQGDLYQRISGEKQSG